MGTEGCLIIHVSSSDPMHRMKSMHRTVETLSGMRPRDLTVMSNGNRNVTDESGSDPSETDALVSSAERKTTRKRSSRNMTFITSSGNPESETAVDAKHDETGDLDDDGDDDDDESESSCSSNSTSAQHVETEKDFEVALSWLRNNRILLRRLEQAAPRGKLSMINLTRRGIGCSEALLLHDAIQLNPFLSVLKLSYNDLGDAGATVIAKAFIKDNMHHQKLSVLDLGFNDIGDEGCEAVALLVIAGNPNISGVYLSGNRISQHGALAIATAILHGSGLFCLHLTGNKIGPSGLKAIAGAVAKHDATVMHLMQQRRGSTDMVTPTLKELHVGNTGLNSTGFIAIPGMMLSNASMKVLSLANNHITDEDILLLSQALTQNKSAPLESLELSFNEISDQGVECLMNAIWGSETLRVLKLDNNKLQDRGAQLCAVVLTSIALTLLDVGFNRVTTVGIKALMKNVSESNSICSLGLNGIPVDQNASKALAYALAYNTSLATLNLDNCSMGYAAQRHIVAGIISNRRAALRSFTGFPIAQIAMTLGIPRLPENWSNTQVLGFVRLMWQQWNLKSGQGRMPNGAEVRGPAPPASVAAAAKIALTSLGTSLERYFKTQMHNIPFSDGPPVDPASTSLMERSPSGTLGVPNFSDSIAGDLHEWVEEENLGQCVSEDSRAAIAVSPLEDPVRRNKNLKWLKSHFRSLSEVGRLPFNNADLWQLHQYYFSPPVVGEEEKSDEDDDRAACEVPGDLSAPQNSPTLKNGSSLGRSVSFSTLSAAFTVGELKPDLNHFHQKRTHDEGPEAHLSKRAKSLKTRIGFYPRIMEKIQSTGTRPINQTLSLLRQLKYTERVFFENKDPYENVHSKDPVHQDIEMILLDLL